MQKPILVVLAAGMASRYGSLKQMEPLGTNGEVLLDYSAFDAMRAGFGKIVFVIRHDFENDFRDVILSRIEKHIPCEVAFQELDSLIPDGTSTPGREKPWGTCHAVACAAPLLDAPFAVINADDFYGRAAFDALAQCPADLGGIVPYRLGRVLSTQGTVSRGRCDIVDGYLTGVEETYKIRRDDDGVIRGEDANGVVRELSDDTLVSMNCWIFPMRAKDLFVSYWQKFITENFTEPKKECLLPDAVMALVKNGDVRVKILDTESEWFGVTYRADRESAVRRLAELTDIGEYTAPLWA